MPASTGKRIRSTDVTASGFRQVDFAHGGSAMHLRDGGQRNLLTAQLVLWRFAFMANTKEPCQSLSPLSSFVPRFNQSLDMPFYCQHRLCRLPDAVYLYRIAPVPDLSTLKQS